MVAIHPTVAGAETKLLRFPDIHDGWVVFTHAGDLWKVPVTGGTAIRLTAHPGLELFAKFSPDGQSIAFTGQYDGDEQVYVIPASGGVPKQLTFYPSIGPLPARWGYDNQVYGWSPDGEKILFRSIRDAFAVKDSRLYTVEKNGGLAQALPMPFAGAGAFSPDGRSVFYSPLFRDFRTWKRYEGGWAQDLYIFDLTTKASKRITDDPRTDRDPMWIKDKLYFVSDRSDYLNIYETDPTTGQTRALTQYRNSDVRWASDDGKSQIVYELDGRLRVLNVETGDDRTIEIFVPDDEVSARPALINAGNAVEDFDISPEGERLLLTARGEIFTVPTNNGVTRNLTQSPGAHEREAAWSPDGAWVAYISDTSGEEELYITAQDGSQTAIQLTTQSDARYYQPRWSPDSTRIAYSDHRGQIWVVDRKTKTPQLVADDGSPFPLRDYSWSPDGRFLAMSLGQINETRAIHVYELNQKKLHRLTDDAFTEREPVWSPDGQYLYYLSDREFMPMIDTVEWNYARGFQTGIFARTLSKAAPSPFPPRNDEVTDDKDKDKQSSDKQDSQKNNVTVSIDFDGLADRITRVPLEPGNLWGLEVTKSHILYMRAGPRYYSARNEERERPDLMSFSIEDREAKLLARSAENYTVAATGNSAIVKHGRTFKRYALPNGDKVKDIALDNVQTYRVPRQEWSAMFDAVWRRMRDHFYVPNMHGYDWNAIGDKYRALLPGIGHRADLNYVIGEMISELNVSHAYISGGDQGLPPRPNTGTLGARLSLDAKSGYYRFDHILPDHNAEDRYRSPLREVGVNIKEGDYLFTINGQPLRRTDNPYALLRGTGNKAVELLVGDKPDPKAARRVIVVTRQNDMALWYLNWVLNNRNVVDQASNGRVGYIHIPDMNAEGIREFVKWFPSVVRKEALIIDVRGNGGGNVSQMILERLRRVMTGMTFPRNADFPTPYPDFLHVGPKVAILNETSASDGDIFPFMFRENGLGPLIGKRSWGGVIGITNRGPLLDGGIVNVPEFGNTDAKGQWVMEGDGVTPDIVVDNDPAAVIAGGDPQLERAIAEAMRSLPATPQSLPQAAPAPIKTPHP